MLVQSLAQRGDLEAAVRLLEDLDYEVGGAPAVVHFASDPRLQRRAMSAARERWRAWRRKAGIRNEPFAAGRREFYSLFALHWRKLPPEEQQVWLREVLSAIETDADQPMVGRFGEDVEFHSTREFLLFQMLGVMRALLPPDEVERILLLHPAVGAAARQYPLGMESLMAEKLPAPRTGQAGEHTGFRYAGSGFAGSRDDLRSFELTMAALRGDPTAVPHLMSEARHLYDIDIARPNTAPRAFWPSCHAHKVAMYWAGKKLGKDAENWLAEIPDPDLALLAGINMAAGALGLAEHHGLRMG